MAFSLGHTAVAGETYTAAQYNTYTKGNLNEIWKFTTAGDMLYATSSTAAARLGIGSAGGILKSTGSAPSWVAGGAAGTVFYNSGTNTPAWLAAGGNGSIMYNNGASTPAWLAAGGNGSVMYNNGASTPAWLAIGTSGYVLKSNGTAPAWASADLEFASVYHNTTQNVLTGTATVLAFNAETSDVQGWHSTVTNNSRLTVAETGYYLASYYFGYAGAGGSGSYYDTIELLQGGATTLAQDRANVGDDAYSKYYSGTFPIVALSATNYVELRFEQNSGDTRAILANARFTLLKVG